MTLCTFQSYEINEIWKDIKPFVTKALNKVDSCYIVEDIKDSLLKAEMQLWTSYDGTQLKSVCITRIVKHPTNQYLEITLLTGSLSALQHLEVLEKWGKQLGCKTIRLTGRKGWERVLKGYEQTVVNLEKEL